MNETAVRRDVYSIVTDRIISQIEQGEIPWKKSLEDDGTVKEKALALDAYYKARMEVNNE